jgi:hypothetical protein
MRKPKVAVLMLACVCAALSVVAQTHAQARRAQGWRRVVPAQSKRAEVLRRLGKPAEGNASYSLYEFEDERARVIYADGRRCAGGGWNVPRGTVLSIIVTPRTELRASDLHLDLSKLEKEAAGDTPAHATYKDEAAGVTYEIFDRAGADYGRVLSITHSPAAKYKRLRCPGAG